jgi:hypothetical protein
MAVPMFQGVYCLSALENWDRRCEFDFADICTPALFCVGIILSDGPTALARSPVTYLYTQF